MKERRETHELIEAKNHDLQLELEEVKAEAESATIAATYLSDIVDELRDIKKDDIEKKKLQLQMAVKEQSWISFVHMMLENIRTNTSMLSTIFDSKVVSKMDHLSALAAACRSAEDESDFPKGRSRHANLHEEPSQEDLLRMTVNKPKTSNHVFFSRPGRRAPG